MQKVYVLFFLVMITLTCFGQAGSVSGVVQSANETIPGAVIRLISTDHSTITDNAGSFQLVEVLPGTYTLSVSSTGFETEQLTITITEGQDLKLTINLHETIELLDEVVVSGTLREVRKTDSPVPVEVYGKQFFQANPVSNLFEGVQLVNGVRPQVNCNVCNTGDVRINGLPGPYTMFLIDGMPIVSGLSTVYGLNGIPQALIERIEVVKGPASTLYGSEAVGGLVNVITENCANAPILAADLFVTSWAELNLDLGTSFDIGDNAKSILGVNYFNYSLPIDNNGDGFTDIALQDRFSLFNKWSIDLAENQSLSIAGRYIYEERWGGQMDWTSEFYGGDSIYGESITTNRWEVLGNYRLPLEDDVNFQFSANGHKQRSAYGTMIYDADQYIGFGQLTWQFARWRNHTILSGLALRYTYYDDNTVATQFGDADRILNEPSVIWLPGIFIQDEINLNSQNKLLLAARYDYNSVHGGIVSPRINYKWNSLNRKTTIRLSAGNGYRVANIFTEDHAALTGAREVVFAEELLPETSWNVNVNAVQTILTSRKAFVSIDASIFYTHFSNQIIPDYDTDPNKIIYANLSGYSVSKGFSANVNTTLTNGVSFNVGFTAMDNYFEEDQVRSRPYFTEQFSGVWKLSIPIAKWSTTIDYTGNITGPMRLPLLSDTDPRAPNSPWWSIQNIQVSKVFNHGITIYGGVKNLLNFTPPSNSIARPQDPFDKNVQFDGDGNAIATPNNPYGLTFDASYVYAPNQGIRGFIGIRYSLNNR